MGGLCPTGDRSIVAVVHRPAHEPGEMSVPVATMAVMDTGTDTDAEDRRKPWWRVTAVFDPDGTGSDFGYTEGLAAAGVPELHLWARPTLGEDPGLDWRLSHRDTAQILNRLAWRLLDGELAVGDTWVQPYDEGFVEAHFSVHPPVTSDEVDAFGAGDAPVLPVKWELRRPPLGEPRALDPVAATQAAASYAALAPAVSARAAPAGWELPASPSWDADQRFGPRTPLVLARGARLWGASADDWITIASNALMAHERLPVGYAGLVSRAAAREPGRLPAVDRLEAAVDEVMAGFGATWGVPQLGELRAWFLDGLEDDPDGPSAWRGLLEEVALAVSTHLVVESVADVLPERILRLGQGLVLGALTPDAAVAPEPGWLCSPTVDRAITELLVRTPLPALVEAAATWDHASHDERTWPVLVTSWGTAGYARPVVDLLGIPACMSAGSALQARGLNLGAIQQWLTSLATVLTERAAIVPEAVDLFVRASWCVPGLERLVNTPLTTKVR
jgi:hypothetical protein